MRKRKEIRESNKEILVLEIVFLNIQENKTINGLNIFNDAFPYTACAYEAILSSRPKKSVIEVMKICDNFHFSLL